VASFAALLLAINDHSELWTVAEQLCISEMVFQAVTPQLQAAAFDGADDALMRWCKAWLALAG
jgi:hypothetical protein